VLSQLLALTGWSFVAACACVFVVAAVTVHAAIDLVEHRRSGAEKRGSTVTRVRHLG
jgi:hypothetical protein